MKNHLVYITTNLINNKQYVGDHSTNNLNDGYLGSGQLIIKAIKKYGKENFKRKILKLCETKEEAFKKQEKYIIKFNTLNPKGYNISPKGGHNVKNCFSEESKRKIGRANKGCIPWNKGKTGVYSKNTLAMMSEKQKGNSYGLGNKSNTGKKFSEDHKEKISIAHKGKLVSEETKQKMSLNHYDCNGENNGMYGKTHTKEARKKISEANKVKIKCIYCNKEFNRLNYRRWHGKNCKNKKNMKLSEQYNNPNRVFYSEKRSTFKEIYPDIKTFKIEISVYEMGNTSKKEKYSYTENNCPIQHQIDSMILRKETSKEKKYICQGKLTSPKGRLFYGYCQKLFEYSIKIEYLSGDKVNI